MQIIFIKILIIASVIFGEDHSSYSYIGGWPVNSKSIEIEDPGFDLPCPGPIGCECKTSSDCNNNNCSNKDAPFCTLFIKERSYFFSKLIS